MRCADHLDIADRLPAEPGEERDIRGLNGGLEPDHAVRLGVCVCGPHQRRADAAGAARRPGDCQAAAAPPAEIEALGGRRQSNTAEHLTAVIAGNQHHSTGIGVDLVEIRTREQSLLVDENLTANGLIRPLGGRVRHSLDRPRGRRRGGCRTQQYVAEVEHQAPAAVSALQAPQAAQPACWSAPSMPAVCSSSATRRVTSATRSAAGAGTPSAIASVPARGR